jgi:hypothetical protein
MANWTRFLSPSRARTALTCALDRAFDDVQPGCDLRVGEPGPHEPNHIALPVGQALHSLARRGLPAQPGKRVMMR